MFSNLAGGFVIRGPGGCSWLSCWCWSWHRPGSTKAQIVTIGILTTNCQGLGLLTLGFRVAISSNPEDV